MKTRHNHLAFSLSSAIFAWLLSVAVVQAQSTWNGGGTPDGNFSNAANWDTAPTSGGGNTLNFDGSVNLNATNNITLTSADQTINFNATASAFTIWGGAIRLGSIANNSAVLQTIMPSLRLNGTRSINVGTAGLLLGQPVGSTGSGIRTVNKSGSGALIVSGNAGAAGGGSSYNVTQGGLVFSNSTGQTTGAGGGGVSLANSGTTLQFNNAGAVTLGGAITTVSGSTVALNNSGAVTVTGGTTIAAGASLTGVGSLLGGAVSVSGTVAPGTSGIGTISVVNLTLAPGSTVTMDIDRNASQKADLISASGTLTFDGTLQVVNIGGTLQAGDVFNLFSGTLAGSFSSTDLPALNPGLTWDLSQLGTAGTIAVTPVPEPAAAAVLGLGATSLLLFRRRKV